MLEIRVKYYESRLTITLRKLSMYNKNEFITRETQVWLHISIFHFALSLNLIKYFDIFFKFSDLSLALQTYVSVGLPYVFFFLRLMHNKVYKYE